MRNVFVAVYYFRTKSGVKGYAELDMMDGTKIPRVVEKLQKEVDSLRF